MKIVKLSIFMLIVMILAISAVSAEEINESSDVAILSADGIDKVASDDADVLADGEDSTVTNTPVVGNFTELKKTIEENENGLVELEKDYAYIEDDGDFASGISINKGISINGNGHTIDGSNAVRIFSLDAHNIIIKNITFKNAKSPGQNPVDFGGAIYSNGAYENHTISDSKFYNNTAYNGGAVYLGGDYSKISGCEFEDNNATASGGAVMVIGWNDAIVESTFNKNYAKETGGAIAWLSAKAGELKDSEFNNNIAGQAGGAISWQKAGGQIVGTTFTANEAPNAGALYWKGNEGTITGGKFSKNKANGNLGGAIFADANANAKLTISSTFEENSAKNGGAIALFEDAEIKDSVFTKNSAEGQAGALFINEDVNAKLETSKFNDNAAVEGNAVYNKGNLTVSNNTYGADQDIEGEEINKDGSKVTIEPIANVTYGQPVIINIEIENRTNNVTVSVARIDLEGSQPDIEDLNYTVEGNVVTIYGLNAGEYKVQILNIGDNNYKTDGEIGYFNVTKATPDLDIKNVYVNEFGHIIAEVTINKDIFDSIYLKIDNEDTKYDNNPRDGYAKIEAYGEYEIGIHNVTVFFWGDDFNYKEASKNATVEITKETPVIEIINATVDEFGAIVVNANITKVTSGNVTFTFIDTGKNITVPGIEIGENGAIVYNELEPFEKSFYTVVIHYYGDNKYYEAEDISYVDVNKTASSIVVDVSSIGDNISVKVTADNNTVTGKVNITLFTTNGTEYANVVKDMVNGVVEEFNFTEIEIGDYYVVADFLGSDDFYKNSAQNETEVRFNTDMDLNVTVDDYGIITAVANVTKGATGNITFIIMNSAGVEVGSLTVDIENGTAEYSPLAKYEKGMYYTVNATYNGDSTYGKVVKSDKVQITKEYLNVTSKVNLIAGANEVNIVLTFPDKLNGKNITVLFPSGAKDNYTVSNGKAVIDEIFDNGNQYIQIEYPGDENYYGIFDEYVEFFVKASSFISAKNVNVVYLNKGKVTVTLTDNNDRKGKNPIANAEVVITLNGKTYKGKTNAKGVATIYITANLVPKKYTATVAYKGTTSTVGDKATFKFTVKKANPKLTAKKKTFKAKTKVKKYTIVLKNNKNKVMKKTKVYLKVKGKTITAKTNSKGKAVFKIKNLKKKGTYTAKITFKANKYFNKVTKKVKIKVRR